MDKTHHAAIERDFVAYALAQTPPLVHAWRGDQLAEDWARSVARFVSFLSDDDTANAFAETMSVLGLPPEHFKAKLLDVDGHRFLAQIDFTNTAGDTPFVAIFRGSQLPGAFATRTVIDAIAERFAIFAPVGVRFFHPSHVPMVLPGTRADQHFLAAPVGDMLARQEAPGYSRVKLTAPGDLAFYPRYVETYEQVFTMRPELRGEVNIETQEALGGCLAEKLLFEIAVDGAWAGIVAARRQTLAGLELGFHGGNPARPTRARPSIGARRPPAFRARDLADGSPGDRLGNDCPDQPAVAENGAARGSHGDRRLVLD